MQMRKGALYDTVNQLLQLQFYQFNIIILLHASGKHKNKKS